MSMPIDLPERLRSAIVEHLALLSDFEAQRAYEDNVPIAQVPAELIIGWFGDSYHPGEPEFQAGFSERELVLLEEFNTFFEHRCDVLGTNGTVRDLQAQTEWAEIRLAASETLRRLQGRSR